MAVLGRIPQTPIATSIAMCRLAEGGRVALSAADVEGEEAEDDQVRDGKEAGRTRATVVSGRVEKEHALRRRRRSSTLRWLTTLGRVAPQLMRLQHRPQRHMLPLTTLT